jgi:hypothetical protein
MLGSDATSVYVKAAPLTASLCLLRDALAPGSVG